MTNARNPPWLLQPKLSRQPQRPLQWLLAAQRLGGASEEKETSSSFGAAFRVSGFRLWGLGYRVSEKIPWAVFAKGPFVRGTPSRDPLDCC